MALVTVVLDYRGVNVPLMSPCYNQLFRFADTLMDLERDIADFPVQRPHQEKRSGVIWNNLNNLAAIIRVISLSQIA